MNHITTIAFDADDTLWANEIFFRESENKFFNLFKKYMPKAQLEDEFLAIEILNMPLYGFGVKAFILSMVETALKISEGKADPALIEKIIEIGKDQLSKPVELLNDVEQVLKSLQGKYRLVLATKGDLLDQERKLQKSGLEKYFHHIEIMSDKKVSDYEKLISHLDCKPENFLMIGNSLKSDIIPVLEIGAYAAYIPYHVTWNYEKTTAEPGTSKYFKLNKIIEILTLLRN